MKEMKWFILYLSVPREEKAPESPLHVASLGYSIKSSPIGVVSFCWVGELDGGGVVLNCNERTVIRMLIRTLSLYQNQTQLG